MPRRPLSRSAVLAVALALVLSACSGGRNDAASGGGGGGGDDRSLTGALSTTFNPDPDQFFELEGVMVTNSVYEGLVTTPPQSTEVEGLLAEEWEISDDGLTYTFTLRDDITFADGTPIDSAAILSSFERRTESAGSPSYMLAEVEGYETPDEQTFVINLVQPVNNFLSRLASPWGPKAINPAVIAEQDEAGDALGATYLQTASAGSGPYVIEEFLADQRVVMTQNAEYWGEAPYFEEVELEIIADATARRIQLEAGDLDFVPSLDPEAATSLQGTDGVEVIQPDAYNMVILQVNAHRAPFTDEVRAALPKAIDFAAIVDDVYGEWADVAQQTITANRMPEEYAPWPPEHDPDALVEAFASVPEDQRSTPVILGAMSGDSGVHGRINDILAELLTEAGFTVERQDYPFTDYFGFIGNPDATPHIFTSTQPDDGIHPDHWYRIWMHTEGALNVGGVGLPEADALFDEANAMPPGDEPPYDLYAEGGRLVTEAGHFLPIADQPVIWGIADDLEGATVRYDASQALVIPELTRSAT